MIARTDLLTFVSRHTLGDDIAHGELREVTLEDTTLRRHLGVTYRRQGYLSPAAQRLMTLLRTRGQDLFAAIREESSHRG